MVRMTRGRAWIARARRAAGRDRRPQRGHPQLRRRRRPRSTRTSRRSTRRTRSCAAATRGAPAPAGSATTAVALGLAMPPADEVGYRRGRAPATSPPPPRASPPPAGYEAARCGRSSAGSACSSPASCSASWSSSAAPSGCRACRARSSPPRRPTSRPTWSRCRACAAACSIATATRSPPPRTRRRSSRRPTRSRTRRKAPEKLASILGLDRPAKCWKSLTAESGFSYVARKVDLPTAARVERLELAGIGELPDSRRDLPAGGPGGADGRRGRLRKPGADRARGGRGIGAAAAATANGGSSTTRSANRSGWKPCRKPSDGEDVQLTLDPAIEKKTEQVLAEVGETYAPKGATAIVMDPRSSQVLAMANWPPVDPTDLGSANPEDLINRATGFTYEPGSTFKAFTVSAALEEGQVTPETAFTLPPEHPGRRPHDHRRRGAADRDPERRRNPRPVLQRRRGRRSASRSGSEKFSRWIDRFGFGRPTGVQFPAEERGIVPRLDEYSGSTMGNLPIGQGLSVTPMQMVAGYAAIADGGILRPPQLIERIGDEPVHEPQGRRVIDAAVAAAGARRCSRACWPPAAPPRRSASPATRWRARPGPPRWPKTAATRKPSTSPRSSASPRRRTRGCWSR